MDPTRSLHKRSLINYLENFYRQLYLQKRVLIVEQNTRVFNPSYEAVHDIKLKHASARHRPCKRWRLPCCIIGHVPKKKMYLLWINILILTFQTFYLYGKKMLGPKLFLLTAFLYVLFYVFYMISSCVPIYYILFWNVHFNLPWTVLYIFK